MSDERVKWTRSQAKSELTVITHAMRIGHSVCLDVREPLAGRACVSCVSVCGAGPVTGQRSAGERSAAAAVGPRTFESFALRETAAQPQARTLPAPQRSGSAHSCNLYMVV